MKKDKPVGGALNVLRHLKRSPESKKAHSDFDSLEQPDKTMDTGTAFGIGVRSLQRLRNKDLKRPDDEFDNLEQLNGSDASLGYNSSNSTTIQSISKQQQTALENIGKEFTINDVPNEKTRDRRTTRSVAKPTMQELTDAINQYFNDNPTVTKLSRKDKILTVNGKKTRLKHSIIRGPNGKPYVLFSGKKQRDTEDTSFDLTLGLLGGGSYGRVKLAASLNDGTIIAVKVQPAFPADVSTIDKEAELQKIAGQWLGSAEREHIISKGEYRGATKHYIYSEFFEGKSLKDFFNINFEQLSVEEKLTIILEVLNKTKSLHDLKIVHGDLSFNNILYNQNDSKIAIIDFGLSNIADENGFIKLPQAMDNFYFAPECQDESNPTACYKSDVYSLGQWIKLIKSTVPDPRLNNLAEKMIRVDLNERLSLDESIQEVQDYLIALKAQHSGNRGFSQKK